MEELKGSPKQCQEFLQMYISIEKIILYGKKVHLNNSYYSIRLLHNIRFTDTVMPRNTKLFSNGCKSLFLIFNHLNLGILEKL